MNKFCVECGKILTGRQIILCSDRECHKKYLRRYGNERYWNRRKIRFCIICGAELTGRQKTLCSNSECHKKQAWARRNQKPRFCIVCGIELTYGEKKICSNKECHRKRINEYSHEYRQDNPEKIKKYYQDNQEKLKENGREYYQNNTDKILEREHRRYRRIRGLPEDADLHKESSIERITSGWLQENNIEFIPQYYINLENSTWTYVDFFIKPNICLYCDGNYHHSLPDVKKCDANQNRILPQMGYNVIRLSEVEILEGNKVWYRLVQCLSKYGIDIK